MTPVKQTKLYAKDGIHNGNCFAACIASLLDLPLWMVPPFEDMFGRGGEYRARCDDWLARMFKLEMEEFAPGHEPSPMPEFYIASGPSSRGVLHSVVYSGGKLVHDPHPSNEGISEVRWCWYLQPVSS